MSSRRWGRKKRPPAGWDVIAPVIEALENEMRTGALR